LSHIVTIKTEVRDPAAIKAACRHLHHPQPTYGETRLFSGSRTGWRVQLPAWRYPIVCETETGTVHYDNFNRCWGNPERLDEFLQRYAVEKARIEAHKAGHTCTEQQFEDGSIKVTVNVGGAA